MWPAGCVSGCPEASEGDIQRTQNSWVPTASGCPQEMYKEAKRSPEEKRREVKRICLERRGMFTAMGKCDWKQEPESAGIFLWDDDL